MGGGGGVPRGAWKNRYHQTQEEIKVQYREVTREKSKRRKTNIKEQKERNEADSRKQKKKKKRERKKETLLLNAY